MADRFTICAGRAFASEGLFSDHPADNGGATMRGVTRATLSGWRGYEVSVAELRAITTEEATAIFRAWYWDAVSADALPVGIDGLVFDHALTSGAGRAARMLQTCLGVAIDGRIGPKTIAAAQAADALHLAEQFTALRRAYLAGLDDAKHFGTGWDSRAVKRLAEAKRDIASAALGLVEDPDETTLNRFPAGAQIGKVAGGLLLGALAALAGWVGIDLSGLIQ